MLASLCLCVLMASGSAAITDTLLFEVGGLWVRASNDLVTSIKSVLVSLTDISHPWIWLWLVLGPVGLYYGYQLLWAPINRVRYLGSIGYIPDGKLSMKEMANEVIKRRRVGDPPPVYPNGWFSVMESRALSVGESKSVSCLGLDLAVFRGEDGMAYVIDAYCPHMGANMGVGGRVFGNCLECPFHGWHFKGDNGKCTKIPYIEGKIPDVAKVKSYNVLERNGFIYIWYHAENSEPTWMPPEIEEITSGHWAYRGRSEHHVNAHIEEVPENGADIAHLGQVHGPIITAGIDLRHMWSKVWEFGKHQWKAEWSPRPEPDGHIGSLSLRHALSLFGFHLPMLDMKVTANQIGPGIVYLMFDSPFGNGAYLQSLTPVEPLVQRMIHHIYIHWAVPPFIGKFYLYGEAIMVERDIMIWNNKKYEGKPVFVKSHEDQLVAKHRRWYSQFYSENSPRLTMKKESKLDW